MFTVEDYIEILSGLHSTSVDVKLVKSDYNLINSLGRQTVKGIAYTDRQFELAKNKILFYKDELENNGITVNDSINNLRLPLRQIDRSRWIRITDRLGDDAVYESTMSPFIAIRFSFQKKLISALDRLSRTIGSKPYHYDKINKIQYFQYSEKNLYEIVNAFKDKNFELDDTVKQLMEDIEYMKNNKESYVPGIYGLKLKNLHKNAIKYIISDAGKPTIDNLALYKDREKLYGISHFDTHDLDISINKLTPLSQTIVRRDRRTIFINNKEAPFDRVTESILELNRYPVLVVLNEQNDFDNMHIVYKSFVNIFPSEDFCVLYRKSNDNIDNTHFNQYIKDNNINNSLAKDSKIVYTNTSKMSKTLLKSEWKPRCAILMGSVHTFKINNYLDELDLVIHYDSEMTPFRQYRDDRY